MLFPEIHELSCCGLSYVTHSQPKSFEICSTRPTFIAMFCKSFSCVEQKLVYLVTSRHQTTDAPSRLVFYRRTLMPSSLLQKCGNCPRKLRTCATNSHVESEENRLEWKPKQMMMKNRHQLTVFGCLWPPCLENNALLNWRSQRFSLAKFKQRLTILFSSPQRHSSE